MVTVVYYVGFVCAILLCRGLGNLFFVPMLLDLGFDVCLYLNAFKGWDVRWLIVVYGFGVLVWVLALSGAPSRPVFLVLLLADIGTVLYGLAQPMTLIGSGQPFWNAVSSSVSNVWLMSVLVVIGSLALKSSLIAKLRGRRVDLLTNPKKRFLLPIGVWAAIIVLPSYFQDYVSDAFLAFRYKTAALALVWGWVALELPFYIVHKRLMRELR